MNELKINAQKRQIVGKQVKNLRKSEMIPGAIFGKDFPTLNVVVGKGEFEKVFQEGGHSSVITLAVEGEKPENVLINEVQIDPVSQKSLHVSFHRINLKEEITTNVPLILTGEELSQAVKEGNVVVQSISELEIRCLPTDLPQNITIDISQLATGESFTIRDIKLPKGVELLHGENEDLNIVVVSVTEPTKEEEPVVATATEEAATTPAEGETKPEDSKES